MHIPRLLSARGRDATSSCLLAYTEAAEQAFALKYLIHKGAEQAFALKSLFFLLMPRHRAYLPIQKSRNKVSSISSTPTLPARLRWLGPSGCGKSKAQFAHMSWHRMHRGFIRVNKYDNAHAQQDDHCDLLFFFRNKSS